MKATTEGAVMFYVVNFPNGDEFYACKACATLVFSHDAGACGFPASDDNHSCELHYEGVCTDGTKREDFTTYPIEELELSVRLYNICKRIGVNTFGDFARITPQDLESWEKARPEYAVTGRTLRELMGFQRYIEGLRIL